MEIGEVGVVGQSSGDEEDGVGSVGAGFLELGFVDNKILAQERNFYGIRIT